jgi:hypothetical protein
MPVRRWLALIPVVAVSLVGAFSSASTQAAPTSPACGVERWAVKTLQDSAGRALDLTRVKKTTVNALRSLPVKRGAGGSRGGGVESTVYEVPARLVEAKLEKDEDIHVVIKGVTTPGTMIVEFPTVACSGNATTGAKSRIRKARNAFVAACGTPGKSSFTALKGRATIRGVGFFDFKHGQRGLAPNGIEIHPVLAFTQATCERVTTPPPPPPSPPPAPSNCAPSYPTVCIPPPPPDLDCDEIPYSDFTVRYDVPNPDPHGFDRDRDGIGCES